MSEQEKQPTPMSPTVFEPLIVEGSMDDKGYFVLPRGTCAFLTVGVINQERTGYERKRLGLIMLQSPVEAKIDARSIGITLYEPVEGGPQSIGVMDCFPSSEKLRAREKEYHRVRDAFDIAHPEFCELDGYDQATGIELNKIVQEMEKVDDVDMELTRAFLEGKEDLLRKNGLEKDMIEYVVLSVGVPPEDMPSLRTPAPIDVFLDRLSQEKKKDFGRDN